MKQGGTDYVAVIPARGGSKGIAGKNIIPLGGRPLISHTIAAARQCPRIGRVLVSTDSAEIASVARQWHAEVPFLRPPELAADNTPMLPVLQHVLDNVQVSRAMVLLQPTSPLRTARNIQEAIALFEASEADSVVSVVAVPHQFNPFSVMRVEDGVLIPFIRSQDTTLVDRQCKPLCYARNGPAILVVRPDVLRAGSLYGRRNIGYVMPAFESVDIDDPDDLELARLLMSHNEQISIRNSGMGQEG